MRGSKRKKKKTVEGGAEKKTVEGGAEEKNGERRESKKKKGEIRGEILQRALLRRPPSQPDDPSRIGISRISRKTSQGFNLIPHHLVDGHNEHFSGSDRSRDARICYTLPVE